MCLCKDKAWARTFTETQGGKYPISDHAPGCDEYRVTPYIRFEAFGSSLLMTPSEAMDMLACDDGEHAYTVSVVRLTEDQYERMDEFTGF